MIRRKRRAALPAAELARDPASVRLQQLREQLCVHASKLPPGLYDALQELISQAQIDVDVAEKRLGFMHERYRAVCRSIARGNKRDSAYDDAEKELADTPAACGCEMMKKDFLAVQRALQGLLLPAALYRDDEIYPARVGSGAALAFWIDSGGAG